MSKPMIIWTGLACILAIAFLYKAIMKFRRRRQTNYHMPEMRTGKKRRKFFRRFRYLEGLGD